MEKLSPLPSQPRPPNRTSIKTPITIPIEAPFKKLSERWWEGGKGGGRVGRVEGCKEEVLVTRPGGGRTGNLF